MDRVKEIYNELHKKYTRSIIIHTSLNISIFIVSALIIVLNIFAIRKNPANDSMTKWIFVVVAIMVAITGFFSSINSLFVLRKKNKDITTKIEKINIEKQLFKEKNKHYKKIDNDEELFIRNITEIINN